MEPAKPPLAESIPVSIREEAYSRCGYLLRNSTIDRLNRLNRSKIFQITPLGFWTEGLTLIEGAAEISYNFDLLLSESRD
jgi:hypothetical protein